MTIGWILLSALIVVCALGVVLARGPISSAISLLVGFIGVAVLYLALRAEFVAAVQVLVYAGGILVLYIFGIMLTDSEAIRLTRQTHLQAWPVFVLVLVLFLGVGHKLYHAQYPAPPKPTAEAAASAPKIQVMSPGEKEGGEAVPATNPQKLAGVLYGDYLYPFEVASVLLLVAVLGAVFLAKKEI
jgi:NADH-quinone oxidoreductase subunit J